jgi:hypothetical protein
MSVSFEPVNSGWIVRGGPHHEKHGDDFESSALAEIEEPRIVKIKGLSSTVNSGDFKQMIDGLRRRGVGLVHWDRRKNGETVRRSIRMDEPLQVTMSISDASGEEIFGCVWRKLERHNVAALELAIMQGIGQLAKAELKPNDVMAQS